jgi:hypothetical protein
LGYGLTVQVDYDTLDCKALCQLPDPNDDLRRCPSGLCVSLVVGGITTTYFVYDVYGRVIEERDGSTWQARYTYGAGIDEPLTMEVISGAITVTYYYHRDALGSITEVTDESGTVVERYEYDAVGGGLPSLGVRSTPSISHTFQESCHPEQIWCILEPRTRPS